MNTALKKICIFGLAEGVGTMILKQVDKMDDLDNIQKKVTKENAESLARTGSVAIRTCNVKVDRNMIKRAKKKIDQVCQDGEDFEVAQMLSFLFLGLNDLSLYCKDKEIIQQVEDAALNFTTMYDPNLEDEKIHQAAMEKYQVWMQ